MKQKIETFIRDAIGEQIEFSVTPTENTAFGHYATNVAMKLVAARLPAGRQGQKPFDIAQDKPMEAAREISEKIKAADKDGFFDRIEAAPPGFVNFWLSAKTIQNAFQEFLKSQVISYKSSVISKKPVVVIDYSHPNIAKPMSVAHLRSTIIGAALYNIFTFAGWHAIGDNHLGDWGKQFGVLIAAHKEKLKIKDQKLKLSKDITINELLALYVDYSARMKKDETLNELARAETKKLQDGDPENTKIWKEFYEVSLAEFKKIYEILGVSFDHYLGESFYNGMLSGIVEEALKKGIAERSEGAIVIPIEGKVPFVIQKSDDAYLYATTDLAAIKYRVREFKPDLILYVVDNGQSLHFEELFIAAKKLGYVRNEKLVHTKFGLMLGDDMKKLSTRAGKHVSLEGVLAEAVERAAKVVTEKRPDLGQKEWESVARAVGIGAVKYNDLSQNRQSDIAFSWGKMLNFEGNSAPYLMYAHARLRSILREALQQSSGQAGKVEKSFDAATLTTEADLDLILKLLQFPDVIHRVTEDYFPHHLADYLFALSQEANRFYHKEPVLKAEKDVRAARLRLVASTADVLKTGLNLLGIEALEKM